MALYSTFKYGDGTKYGIAFLPAGVTRLRIYSSAGVLECELREWEKLDYTICSNHWGVLTLKVHRSAQCLSNLVVDSIVEIARYNKIFYYQISYISPKYDETGHATEYLTAIGRDFNRIPYERIIERPAGEDFHSVTDKVDNCMKDLVRKQLVSGFAADADRVWPLFSCEGDESEHADTETFKADHKDNLGELLEQIGAAYSVDFWVDASSPLKYMFRTGYPRRGQDKSSQVVFSIVRHNILGFEHWEDGGEEKTLVYVAGAGEGNNQIIEKYPAAEPTGADRKEAYVAATYIEAAAQLEVYGEAFLDTFGQAATGVSFKFQETDSCKWGIDFDIGDLVTVWDPQFDKTESIKVEEIAIRVDAQGRETLEIRVGKAKPSAWDMLQAQRRLEPQDRLAIEHDHSGDIEGPKIDPADLDPPVVGLSFAVPTVSLSTVAAEGVLDTVVRSDCTIVAFDATVPNTIEPDDVAATGAVAYAARRDHEHAIVCAAAGNIAPDDAAAEGVATSFARSDHAHGFTCATPTDVGSANAEGAGTEFVRDNHVHRGLHSIQKAAAGALYGDVTLSEGTGISLTQAAQDIEIAVSAAVTLFAFKTINCPAGTDPVADAPDDTLNLVAGAGISITGDAGADSVTIAVSAVTRLAFITFACPNAVGVTADIPHDTLTFVNGGGISILGHAGLDEVTIGLHSTAYAFKTFNTDGAAIVADNIGDTATVTGGNAITTSGAADTITVAFDYLVTVAKTNNAVVLRSGGGHIEADAFWIGPVQATHCIIHNTGHLYNLTGADPVTNNTADLGTTDLRYANIWGVVVHEGDHMFDERFCLECHQPFEVGDDLVYRVIAIEQEGTRALPTHARCKKRKIFDD